MTDDELAAYLCPDDIETGHKIIAAQPERRALWERMHEVENEVALWQAGLGPKPTDVILCGPKEIKGALKD